MKRHAIPLLTVILVVGCTATASRQAESAANDSMQIFFSSQDGNGYHRYLMNADGSEQAQLEDYPGCWSGLWSPDGTRIAYACYHTSGGVVIRNVQGEIEGSSASADGSFLDDGPTWAPDSASVAFHSTRDGNREIYSMRYDGENQTRLTFNSLNDDACPAWSPNGQFIAFASGQQGAWALHIMQADGSGTTKLADGPLGSRPVCHFFEWSPDGERLCFESDLGISVINADGTGLIRLVAKDYCAGDCTWSPDGTRIAFVSNRCTNSTDKTDIYAVTSTGSDIANLTDNPGFDAFPAWSPNGRYIAFVSDRDGNYEIYLMNVDGSDQTNLTNSPENESSPVWRR
jgi:Tol biopolymer transport system component